MLEVVCVKRRFPVIIPVLLGVCLLSILFFSTSMSGRNINRPGRYGTTQQGRNLAGESIRGATPNASLLGATPAPGPAKISRLNKTPMPITFDGQKADNIRKGLGKVDGADQINTVVNGNTALIGYTPASKVRDATAVRNTITSRVRQIDSSITNVVVSDSRDISARISRLADGIKSNQPLNDLNAEFTRLVQSIRAAGK